MIRSYQKEDSDIVNKWHAANTKERSKDKAKDKSKDISDSSATRQPGVSVPRTDHEFRRKIGVDDIADLPDCLIKFECGKDFLTHSLMEGLPGFMKRMHSWYRRACRFDLKSIWAQYPPDIFRSQNKGVTDIMFDFQDIQEMFRLQELWCM